MLTYPTIDPVAIQLGPLKIHWYGLMYLIGFLGAWGFGVLRARKPNSGWTSEEVGEFIFYGALGVVVGGRVGYMLFYSFPEFIANPLVFFKVWDGGMSFHGGLLGVLIATWLFKKRFNKDFFTVVDFIAPLAPIGLGAGRIGNFINAELWGKVTDAPWGIVFPHAGPLPRHPSQLYEFLLEGVVMFTVLWWYSAKPRPRMAVSGLFALLYGCFRFFIEFYREPDPQLGYLAFGWLTMGQVLSAPLILIGIILMAMAYKNS